MPKCICFDYAAKKLLRQKANFVVLEGFLTVLLKTGVKIHRMLESESNQEDENDKFNRVDMLAELGGGELVIIEVQNSRIQDYFQRMLYGTSKAVTEYIDLGEDYYNVKKVYSVSIVYFGIGQGEDYAYHGKTEFRGMNKTDDVLRLSKKQQVQFQREFAGDMYPEYFLLKVNDFDSVAKNSLEEWISFLRTGEIPDSFTAPGLPEARERLREGDMSDEERRRYLRYVDNMRYARSAFRTSYTDGEDKGLAKGLKKGLKKGRAEGLAEGLAEGEKRKALEIARNLKRLGIPDGQIAKATKLTAAEIKRLKNGET